MNGSSKDDLGDLKKLGKELTKLERVQMLLDLSGRSHRHPRRHRRVYSHSHVNEKDEKKQKSWSQPGSAVNTGANSDQQSQVGQPNLFCRIEQT